MSATVNPDNTSPSGEDAEPAPVPLFERIDPKWGFKVSVLAAQRQIVEVMAETGWGTPTGGAGVANLEVLESKSFASVLAPAADMIVDPGRGHRTAREPSASLPTSKIHFVGRVLELDDALVSVLLEDARAAGEGEEIEATIPLDEIPRRQRRRLRPGAIFDFTVVRWMNADGDMKSTSRFVIRRPREFTAEERERIDRRAAELDSAFGTRRAS